MGSAPHAAGSWKGNRLVADVDDLQGNDASEVCQKNYVKKQNMHTKKFSCRRKVKNSQSHL